MSTSHAGSPEEHGAGDTHFHNVSLEEGDTFPEAVVLCVNITKKEFRLIICFAHKGLSQDLYGIAAPQLRSTHPTC